MTTQFPHTVDVLFLRQLNDSMMRVGLWLRIQTQPLALWFCLFWLHRFLSYPPLKICESRKRILASKGEVVTSITCLLAGGSYMLPPQIPSHQAPELLEFSYISKTEISVIV